MFKIGHIWQYILYISDTHTLKKKLLSDRSFGSEIKLKKNKV